VKNSNNKHCEQHMANDFTLHVNLFADKVRAMNQQRQTELKLSATDANNLLADITQLATTSARLSQQIMDKEQQDVQISMDGGSFK
jgi:hypothetical protein